jgi:hypothetical protein
MRETTPALPAPKERARRIPPKVRQAIDRLVSGQSKSLTAAAKAVGLSREYVSRSLSKPHVAEFLRQKAARAVAMGAGRAAARLNQLLDSKSEHVSLDAAKLSLDIAGIKPATDTNVNLNIEVRAGYVIDLSERDGPEARIVHVTSGL